MKRKIILSVCTAIICAVSLQAQEYRPALGIRLSTAQATVNNSVSFRYFLDEKSAAEALVSFDPVAIGALYERFLPLGSQGLRWFFGGGAYGAFHKENTIGAMGIVGLDYKFNNVPLNLSIDWKPELNLVRSVNFEAATVGLSLRFVFKSKSSGKREVEEEPVGSTAMF